MSIVQNIIVSHLSTYESAHIYELAEVVNANTYRHHTNYEIVSELMGLVLAKQICVEGEYVWIERVAA